MFSPVTRVVTSTLSVHQLRYHHIFDNMNKFILILSILHFAIGTSELSNYQMYLDDEYGVPTENYQNMNKNQYTQQEINFNNQFNQNYDFDQLSTQPPLIDRQNLGSKYVDIQKSDTIQPIQQKSQLEYDQFNTRNYLNLNPSTESLVIEKSKEIPLDFLSNPSVTIKNLHKADTVSKSEPKFEDIQGLIKEFLWRNYINRVQHTNMQMINNEDLSNNQQNIQLNLPSIGEDNQNIIPAPNNNIELSSTNAKQQLPNENFNFKTEMPQPHIEDSNPSTFAFNNQNFHQINPSRTYFNQFMMKPTHQIPNSKYQIPIFNNNDLAAPLSQIQYSNDLNNKIYPQLSTFTNRNPKYLNAQNRESKVTTKIYAYAAPEETEEEIKEELSKEISPRKHYNVVFIKAPHQFSRNSLKLIQAQAQKDEKTVIYVLSKKINPSEIQQSLDSVRTYENKPMVHFIKYKTDEEAILAQHNIKAQYDNLEENPEILNHEKESILTNPENYLGNNLLQNKINENQNYLPPV